MGRADGRLLKIIEGHTDEVNSTQYSPDGVYILSGSGDGTARIWDGKSLVCSGQSGSVFIWDISDL